MADKYERALIALSEILVDKENALNWKDTQLELRDKEIERLKLLLESIEKNTEKEEKQ